MALKAIDTFDHSETTESEEMEGLRESSEEQDQQ